ncbi:hypothetical protein LINGRAHAP2_LOCUS3906 [Linum grandiflorum]
MRWHIDDQGFPKCTESNQQHVDRMQTPIEAPTGLSKFRPKKASSITNLYQIKQMIIVPQEYSKSIVLLEFQNLLQLPWFLSALAQILSSNALLKCYLTLMRLKIYVKISLRSRRQSKLTLLCRSFLRWS